MKNNEQHAIDTTVRQALENLEIPYKADHWGLMAGKLDALDAEEAEFDKNFADKLARVEVPLQVGHWGLMADKLAALDAEESQFDNDLAAKLAKIEVPYQASNWADMSARLDDLDNSETNFDALFSQRLEHLQVKYQPQHWDFMAEKIEQTFSWRAKIVRYKVVEVALVLLTLFTVGNMLDLPFDFYKENNTEGGIKIEDKKADLKKTTPKKTNETKSFNNPTEWRNRTGTPNNTPINTNGKPIVSVENEPLDIVPNTEIVENQTKNLGNNTSNRLVNVNAGIVETTIKNTQNTASDIPQSENKVNQSGTVSENTVASTSENELQIKQYTEGGLQGVPLRKVLAIGRVKDGYEEDKTDAQIVAMATARVLQPADVLKPSLLNTEFYDENIVFPRQKEKKAKLRLNIFGLPIADLVSYNYVNKRTLVNEKQIASNLGMGVAVGFKKDKFEIESGLSYLDKKYDLPNVEYISGNFRSDYKVEKPLNLHLSIVSIPLSINLTAKETPRWRFYARFGTALNVLFKTREETFKTGPNSNNNNTDYEGNVYPKGILVDGLFKDPEKTGSNGFKRNSYVTVNAGIGVEYRLTHNADIYLQPNYDYHFSERGIGTLNDRINSFSFQGGVKMKLK